MPDNVTYLYLGLTVVLGLVSFYVFVLFLRLCSAFREGQRMQDFRE